MYDDMDKEQLKELRQFLLNRKNKVSQDFFLECKKLPEGSLLPKVDRCMPEALEKLIREVDDALNTRFSIY